MFGPGFPSPFPTVRLNEPQARDCCAGEKATLSQTFAAR